MQTIIHFIQQLSTLDFWQGLLDTFQSAGPFTAVALAMIESFFPALPLTAIAVLNVTAYGLFPGFLLTWGGSCVGCTITFFFFRYCYNFIASHVKGKKEKAEKARAFIRSFDFAALFLILCLPFTPSSFMNFAFGVSDYPSGKYLITLYTAKVFMIGSLALFGDGVSEFLKDPLRLIPSLVLMAILYYASVKIRKKHNLE